MEAFENNLSLIDPDSNHFNTHIDFQTHSMDSFIDKQDIEPKSLKILHHNSRSLMSSGKLDQYDVFFKALKNPFDILIFTESWLTLDNSDLCKFDGFQNPEHLLRPSDDMIDFKTKGGGISIFVKNNIQYKYRNDLIIMLPFIECSFIEIEFNHQKYLIGGIYRIPNTSIDLFIDKLSSIIEPLKSSHKLILLGDYNIDLLKNDSNKNKFEICLQSNYLVPTIFSATRVATIKQNGQYITTKTLIDNIFINHNINHQSGIIESTISDHYPIYIIIPELAGISKAKPNSVQYRLINDLRQRKFNNELNQSDIKGVLNNNNAELAYEQFFSIFQSIYDISFPIKIKILTEKDIQKPWINDTLIKRLKIRENLNRLSKKNRICRKIFTNFRNKVTTQLRLAKAKYFEEQFETHKNNIKKTWEVINSVIRSKRVKSKVSLTDEDGNYHEEHTIPSKFIEHFSSIPNKLASKIPPTQKNAASYLNNRVQQSFFISPIIPTDINPIIVDLKDNGNNVNTVATSVLVGCKHIITPILCHLINLFVQQGYFPDNLKTGCITPIYKKGDREKVNNYRPVCSLSPLSKIIEKVINNRMVEYLDKYRLLSKTQYGFRKNMGTENALLNYIDFLQKELNDKKYAISVFIDLSKAFDVIDHKILSMKLEYYGFRGKFLDFLLSFIKDRKYFVNINGTNSETKTVNIGVPQGSTLGSLLLLLYINDMVLIF